MKEKRSGDEKENRPRKKNGDMSDLQWRDHMGPQRWEVSRPGLGRQQSLAALPWAKEKEKGAEAGSQPCQIDRWRRVHAFLRSVRHSSMGNLRLRVHGGGAMKANDNAHTLLRLQRYHD